MKSIIPVLQHGLTNLTNPQDILIYILRHFTQMPSGTTDSFYSMELSLTTLYAESGNDKLIFENKVITALTEALNRIFGTGSSIEVKAYMGESEQDKNSIFIEMSVFVNGVMYSTSNVVNLSKDLDKKMSLNNNGEINYL